ncbi:MAG: hypothetical protein HYT79_03450 [Elusimicrobia bacterium]|nr:hypothetical protein [Elusimicrobiota bacterium]
MEVHKTLDVRWLSFSYALRGVLMALDAMTQGQALELRVDSFVAADFKSSLESQGYKVDRIGEKIEGADITLIVAKSACGPAD